jgi:hypothetical protein
MKIVTNICLSLFILLTACKDKSSINIDLFKNDWVSDIDKYDNIYRLYVEDSLMFETLTPGIDPVVPYKISSDTLIIVTKDYDPYPRIKIKTYKYKIVTLDSLKLTLKQILPPSRDSIFFNMENQVKKNNLSVIQLEFFSGICLGSCPIQSIRIDSDSTLYHFGYRNTKHLGLSKGKLSPSEYSKLQKSLNSVDRDSFKLCIAAPDASNFKLFIKSQNDSIETNGMFCSNYNDFNKFISYMRFLERFLTLDSIGDKDNVFRYKHEIFNE